MGASEPATDAAAAVAVVAQDPALVPLIEVLGPPAIRAPLENYFAALVRDITFQQLAGRAATAIHGRLLATFADGLSPEAVLATPDVALRAAGLSGAKCASIRDLAVKFVDGTVPASGCEELPDETIIERLTAVRGIGRWTAEMFLIFQLRRPDVWPVDDLGVRNGYAIAHRLAVTPKPVELMALGERYRPFRSTAAWYCWRANDTVLP